MHFLFCGRLDRFLLRIAPPPVGCVTHRDDKQKLLSLFLALLILICTFSACAGNAAKPETPSSAASSDSTRPVIGISMSTQTQARQLKDVEYLTASLDALGYDVLVQYADMDPTKQVSQIENMINNGVAGIIISAWDAESLSSAVDTAAANNIKVVCYDMLVSNTKNVSYYVTDNLYDCGRLQGEYIVKALDLDNTAESFNLELFSGDPADSNAPYFFNGAYDALSPYIESGKLNVLSGQTERDVTATANWDGLKAQERMDTILSTYYKGDTRIDAVMCNNDAIALGVLASLKNVGYGTAEKPFPIITGMDCDIANIKAIKSGEISMTVFKDNRIIAKKAAEVMDCVLHDKTPQAGDAFETTFNNGVCDVTAFLIAPEVIDKDNYQAVLFDSGYYSEDQLK